jgi:hypothetical protein
MTTNSLILDEFRDSNISEIGNDISHIMSLNTAFKILLICETEENCSYNSLSSELKSSVDSGLRSGIIEIEKIRGYVKKCLDGDTTIKEKAYLYDVLIVFCYLNGNELIANSVLKNNLDVSDIRRLEEAINKLENLKMHLEKIKSKKSIKNAELDNLRMNRTVDEIGRTSSNLFKNWIFGVNSLDSQYEY